MTHPERDNAPGDADAVGPVAAGPTARTVGPVAAGPMAAPPEPVHTYVTLSRGGYTRVTRTIISPEERVRMLARQWAATQRWEEQERATVRSRALLLRLLTPAQRAMFEARRYFEVRGESGRTYRIHCGGGREGNIKWVDALGFQMGSFCVAPAGYHLPIWDAFLGQMLLIATDEDKFLRTAVFSGPMHPTQGPISRFFHNLRTMY